MLFKREIISISPLPSYPGYWLLAGRTDGEFGDWYVIRKPNGTYWTAVMPIYAENETAVVEIGDRVTDERAITQFEAGFLNLRQGRRCSQSVINPPDSGNTSFLSTDH